MFHGSICLSIDLSIYLSIDLPIYLSIDLSIYLSFCLSVCLSVYMIYLFYLCYSLLFYCILFSSSLGSSDYSFNSLLFYSILLFSSSYSYSWRKEPATWVGFAMQGARKRGLMVGFQSLLHSLSKGFPRYGNGSYLCGGKSCLFFRYPKH